MAIIGLVLYGSRSRGDHDEHSDVDLLALTRGDTAPAAASGRLRLSRYPLDHVIARARAGDLFAWHLVCEGRVLYEREPAFARVVRAFRLRADYSREIALASDVGWLLVHHRERLPRLSPRMAWCTHTMIVARAAAAGRPVFSAAGLADF